jgi:hypothetical protein
MLLSNMFSAWRTKSKIWEAQLAIDPAGTTSSLYITRDDVHTDPVTVHYLGHIYGTHMD